MKSYYNAIFYAIAIVVFAIVIANAYRSRNAVASNNYITVTGLGETNFTSDLIVWSGNFSEESLNLKVASDQLKSDRENIEKYLLSKGLNKNDLVFSAISIVKQTTSRYTESGKYIGDVFTGYKLTQSIQITSHDIPTIENISRSITDLVNQGIAFNSSSPRYYYTKLPDLKIELVSKATQDARKRAETIAQEAGNRLGKLESAKMGVIQITGQNSDESYSWGGTFNTSSKDKTASITMTLKYEIK